MLPDIENLLKLQVTDKEIRRLQDEIAEFPKRVAVIEQKLAGTKAQLEKAQAASKPTKPPAASTTPPSTIFAAKFPSIATSPST